MQFAREQARASPRERYPSGDHPAFLGLADESFGLGHWSQILRQEEPDRLIGAARRHEDVEQHRPRGSAIAGLLKQLALGGKKWVFARNVEQSGGRLPEHGRNRVTVLLQQENL